MNVSREAGGSIRYDYERAEGGGWKPPVVLICQNNHWSISVPPSRQTASETIAIKGRDDAAESILLGDMPRAYVQDNLTFYRVVRERLVDQKKMP